MSNQIEVEILQVQFPKEAIFLPMNDENYKKMLMVSRFKENCSPDDTDVVDIFGSSHCLESAELDSFFVRKILVNVPTSAVVTPADRSLNFPS
jgi:hypothetical protein